MTITSLPSSRVTFEQQEVVDGLQVTMGLWPDLEAATWLIRPSGLSVVLTPGMTLTPQVSNPHGATTLWTDGFNMYFGATPVGGGGAGTVVSVGLAMPSIFSVSGSPVTASGTLTATLNTQTANTFFSGPAAGAAAIPTFRTITVDDLGTGASAGRMLLAQTSSAMSWTLMSGDATLSGLGVLTLATVIAAGGPIGSAGTTPVITWDAKGRLTTVTTATITPLAIGAVPVGPVTSSGLTMATNKLLGRSTAGTGAIEQITIGSGLLLSGGTLTNVGPGSGTVTSVGLSLPSIFTVTVTPVTTSGTLTAILASQAANLVWAGPASGAAAAPTFRSLVPLDLATTPSSGQLVIAQSGSTMSWVTVGGDATLANTGVLTLATTITAGGPTGTSSTVPVITYDAKGRLTTVTTATITPAAIGAVPVGPVTTSGLTMSTARLLGRTTAATGAIEEISVGTGLTLSGGTLSLTAPITGGGTAGQVTFWDGPSDITGNNDFTYDTGTSIARLAGSGTSAVLNLERLGTSTGSILMGAVGDRNTTDTFDSLVITNALTTGGITFKFDDAGTASFLGTGFITQFELDAAVSIVAGTAAFPGLAFNGDLDTGIYHIAANTLGISTAGVLALTVDSIGDVIGAAQIRAPGIAAFDNTFIYWDGTAFALGATQMYDWLLPCPFVKARSTRNGGIDSGVAFYQTSSVDGVLLTGVVGLEAPASFDSPGTEYTNMYFLTNDNTGVLVQRMKLMYTGGIQATSSGSAGTPTWTFASDASTGAWLNGAGKYAISASGTHILQATSTAVTINGDIVYSPTAGTLIADTIDGADTKSITISGGGGPADSRGGLLQLRGNENASLPGYVRIYAGQVGGSLIQLGASGSNDLVISSTAITSTLPYRAANGSVGAPSYSFTSDSTSGMFYGGGGLQLSAGGVTQFLLVSGAIFAGSPILGPSGSAASPMYNFQTGGDTGMYLVGADDLGFSANGILRLDISTTAITSTLPFYGAAGSAGAPTYSFASDPNTGMYSFGADDLGFAANGAIGLRVNATEVISEKSFRVNGFLGAYASQPGLSIDQRSSGSSYIVGWSGSLTVPDVIVVHGVTSDGQYIGSRLTLNPLQSVLDHGGLLINQTINYDNSPALDIIPGDQNSYAVTSELYAVRVRAATQMFYTGTPFTTNRYVSIEAPTYIGQSAFVITTAATFAISGPPVASTNMTITTAYSMWVMSGTSQFDGNVNITGTLAGFLGDIVLVSGTTLTLSDAHQGRILRFTNGAAITVTVPSTLNVGFTCTMVQDGAGTITVVAGAGATVQNRSSQFSTAGQNAVVSIVSLVATFSTLAGDTV